MNNWQIEFNFPDEYTQEERVKFRQGIEDKLAEIFKPLMDKQQEKEEVIQNAR